MHRLGSTGRCPEAPSSEYLCPLFGSPQQSIVAPLHSIIDVDPVLDFRISAPCNSRHPKGISKMAHRLFHDRLKMSDLYAAPILIRSLFGTPLRSHNLISVIFTHPMPPCPYPKVPPAAPSPASSPKDGTPGTHAHQFCSP